MTYVNCSTAFTIIIILKMFRAYETSNQIYYNAVVVIVTELLVCRENQPNKFS